MFHTVPVRRVFSVVNGGTPTPESGNWDGGVPWATPVDLGATGLRISSTDRTLTAAGVRTGSRSVPTGSILLSTRAPIGYVAVTDCEMAFNQGCRGLVPRIPGDPRFFAYQLLAARADLQAAGQGSTFMELTSEGLAAFPVIMAPLEEQRRIADFLDSQTALLDHALHLRRRQEVLAEERLESLLYAACTLASRPSAPLKSLAWYKEGPGIMAVDFRESGTPVIRLAGVKADTVTLEGCNFVDPVQAARQWAHLAVRAGELLISGSAGTRFPVLVPETVAGAIPYTGLIRVGPRDGRLSRDFLRYFLGSPVFVAQVNRLKTGIGVQHWGPFHLGQVQMPYLELTEQERLASEMRIAEREHRELKSLHMRHAALLRERKRALITAAVAGHLDATTARNVA